MSYIGAEPSTAAFPFDQFSGTGAATSFTLTYAPASATSIIVAISGVVQNPNLYSVIGTTITFSPAPPAGSNNISVLYLGLPVIGAALPGNTAFLSATDLTATAGQTVFASAGSYTPGFVQVYRNGVRLGNADFTATNGTTITLAVGAVAGDLITIEYYTLSSLVNALPLTGGTVTGSTTFNSAVNINGGAVSGFTGMKNRIINGNMVVDQRNAGANVTPTAGTFLTDRWAFYVSQASKITAQQNKGAITPPTGFSNYLGISSSSAYALSATDQFTLYQKVEGFNFADMAWGTTSAATVVLSFRVYSSLTGTFGGSLQNSAANRCYPFSYSVPVANTWTTVSITIAGDTTGTWIGGTNGVGVNVNFSLGTGSTYSGTAGAWVGADYITSVTGAVSVVGTSGATFYITGVQLERGTNATSFEFIDYGRQLMQCQRYFYNIVSGNAKSIGMGSYETATRMSTVVYLPVTMRAAPTLTQTTGTGYYYIYRNGDYDGFNSFTIGNATINIVNLANTSEVSGTAGQSGFVSTDNASASLSVSSEL